MLEVSKIEKKYQMGENTVFALRSVSLKIEAGDFVAIMGPSGSGKSTLMHILGLLDVPDQGSYLLNGQEVAHLKEEQLAEARRSQIGFVFQQFNLLPRMTALENASLPTLYSDHHLDLEKGKSVLEKVGLGSRMSHRSNELSGGQQQRVAIARSLVNHPQVILADEPTGNLDSTSEKEIMDILKGLNAQGITVIIVTHEEEIGQQARRLIRMRDGKIQSDERIGDSSFASRTKVPLGPKTNSSHQPETFFSRLGLAGILEDLDQGFKTLYSNKVRTALSMLGILIGVAAVVAMLALGRGAQKMIESQLSSLGSNLLVLRPGAARVGGVSFEAGATTRLTFEDAIAIRDQVPGVKDVGPSVNGRSQVVFQSKNWNTRILGGAPSYFEMHASLPQIGRIFTETENKTRARVAVIGPTVARELFGDRSPLGETIKINRAGFLVIGVLPFKGATGWRDQDDMIVVPVLTAMHRLLGKDWVDFIDVEAASPEEVALVQSASVDLIGARHKVPASQREEAFQIRNMADIQEALSQSSRTMSMLLASIAAISLVVGGIGIMNIMLVSVTERTREIGLRKAVGAKPWDILSQFLAEAVVVSTVGGIFGIILGWLSSVALSSLAGWSTSISPDSVFLAFFFSAAIGIIFGIYPARKASRLSPIDALRYE